MFFPYFVEGVVAFLKAMGRALIRCLLLSGSLTEGEECAAEVYWADLGGSEDEWRKMKDR